MSDCPQCEWTYDRYDACICVRPVGGGLPLVWDGQALRIARGQDAPAPKPAATAAHLCEAHPLMPEVLIWGPVERYAPLAGINALLTAMSERPSSLLLGLGGKARAKVREAQERPVA